MKLNPSVLMRKEFDDNGIVFDPENNKAMSLNATGTAIWEAIEKGLGIDEITAVIARKFEVEPDAARKDVELFLEQLKSKGLLSE